MMKKLITYLAAGLSFIGSASCQENVNADIIDSNKVYISRLEDKVLNDGWMEKYKQENVFHLDWSGLDFDNYDLKPIDPYVKGKITSMIYDFENKTILIPDSVEKKWFAEYGPFLDSIKLDYIFNISRIHYDGNLDSSNLNKFNMYLTKKLVENNKTDKAISGMNAREALELVFYTTKEMLEYKDVDFGAYRVAGVAYNDLPFDDRIYLGVGDCNIYASLAIHLWRNVKEINSNFENICMGHSLYSRVNFHDWVQLYFTDGDKFYISSIDLSREPMNEAVGNFEDFYFSESEDENLLPFYHKMMDRIWGDVWADLFFDAYNMADLYNRAKGDNWSSFGKFDKLFFPKVFK